MWNLLKILFGGALGFGLAKLIEDGKDKPKITCGYLVYVRSENFDKSYLLFDDYDEAEKIYEKIASNKKVSYKDVIEHDADEAKIYHSNKGQEGYPKLSDTSKVNDVILQDQNGKAIKEKKLKQY